MKIIVDGNLRMGTAFTQEEIELETQVTTLKELLKELPEHMSLGVMLIDSETSEVDPDCYSISIDGCSYESLPRGLETRLRDGDKISVIRWLAPLGGG